MKILALYPYIPYPTDRGGHYRGFHLLKALAQEHEVDLIALAENGTGAAYHSVFADFCRSVEVLPFQHPAWQRLIPKRLLNPLPSTVAHWMIPQLKSCLDKLLPTRRYDAVHVFDIVLAQFCLNEHQQIPLVADRTRVDLQYQLMERRSMNFPLRTRILNWENLLKLWRYERAVARRCRLQIVCGPDDEMFVRRFIRRSTRIAVIPNGVDLDYFSSANAGKQPRASEPTLLFCGAMDYNPNIDALRWYFSEMHQAVRKQIPELRVLIVGKDPVSEVEAYGMMPGVTVTGGVPDVRPFYRQAWMQIVPLRIGGGTRLKIVESLAMGTPVVSTTIGAQGLGLEHGFDTLLADDAPAFISETVRALRDTALRDSLTINGSNTVRQRLSWSSLGQQLCQAYSRHVSASPNTGTN